MASTASEIIDCVSRAMLGTTYGEAAEAEAQAAQAAAAGLHGQLWPRSATPAAAGRAGSGATEGAAGATEMTEGLTLPRPRAVEAAGAESNYQRRAAERQRAREQRLSISGNRRPAGANTTSKQPAPVYHWDAIAGVRNDTSHAFIIFRGATLGASYGARLENLVRSCSSTPDTALTPSSFLYFSAGSIP